MILADKILNLRRKNGWSQEELAEKLNVSRQSISKWEGALSIPDIGKIIELAAIFGVTTDYLLKDDIESAEYTERDESDKRVRVSIADANDYIKMKTTQGKLIAIGVMLVILAVVPLIVLSGISDGAGSFISENLAVAVGLITLFLMVSLAVALFIVSGAGARRFRHIEDGNFVLEYGVSGILGEKFNEFERRYTYSVVIAIVMCIFSVIPLIVTALLFENDLNVIFMVGLMLAIVSAAVYIFVRFGTKKGAYDRMLGLGDYEPDKVKKTKRSEKLAGFFWPLVTAGYLLWSFITNDWHITWLVWPVAALVFAGISALIDSDEA